MDYPERNYTIVEIPKTLHQEVKAFAQKNKTSVKAIVFEAVTNFLKREKEFEEELKEGGFIGKCV